MGPAELAGLVAREADAGVAEALRAMDSAGALAVERVIGRIGSRPTTAQPAWEDVVWQAEVVMRPTGTLHAAGPSAQEPDPEGVSELVSRLTVSALRGVGPGWTERLRQRGVLTVGDLASTTPASLASWSRETDGGYAVQLVARARSCAVPWPSVDAADTRSLLEVSESDPGEVDGWPPGSRAGAHGLWAACLTLRAALDDDVLVRLRVNGA